MAKMVSRNFRMISYQLSKHQLEEGHFARNSSQILKIYTDLLGFCYMSTPEPITLADEKLIT